MRAATRGKRESKKDQDDGLGQHDYAAGSQYLFPGAEGGGTVGSIFEKWRLSTNT
jgi:hypothetical protein